MQNTYNQKALLGGGRVWLERRSPLLLPFEAKSQLASPSRLAGDCSGFMSQGCKQVPLEYTRGIIRWAHPDGYFLNAQGQKVAHCFSPAQLKIPNDPTRKTGKLYPTDRGTGGKNCHILMALAFYGPRLMFNDKWEMTNDKCQMAHVGICHHLIPDPRDYKPANLLCWLTREQHTEADRRQRALRKRVPDLHAFTYERLRELQDPRTMPREEFERQLALIPVFTIDPDCDRREPYKHC